MAPEQKKGNEQEVKKAVSNQVEKKGFWNWFDKKHIGSKITYGITICVVIFYLVVASIDLSLRLDDKNMEGFIPQTLGAFSILINAFTMIGVVAILEDRITRKQA